MRVSSRFGGQETVVGGEDVGVCGCDKAVVVMEMASWPTPMKSCSNGSAIVS